MWSTPAECVSSSSHPDSTHSPSLKLNVCLRHTLIVSWQDFPHHVIQWVELLNLWNLYTVVQIFIASSSEFLTIHQKKTKEKMLHSEQTKKMLSDHRKSLQDLKKSYEESEGKGRHMWFDLILRFMYTTHFHMVMCVYI